MSNLCDTKLIQVLLGRALAGAGAANATLSMSYITRTTAPENRTRAIAMISGVNLLGVVVG